jgi:hypothetical protein
MVDVEIVTRGTEAATPDAWTFPGGFVPALSGTAVAAGLAARVRCGETVDVGGLLISGDGGYAGVLGCLRHVEGQGLLRWRTGG